MATSGPPRRLLKRIGVGLVATLALCAGLVGVGGYLVSGPRYRGAPSDHFDGKAFHNVPPLPRAGFLGFLKWRLTRAPGAWIDRPLPIERPPPPPGAVGPHDMRVTFINHATVLLQVSGLNILTDPIWSQRTSPVGFAGPRRHHPPGVRFEDLPPIHAVIVSHNHYDHLDLPTLKRLQAVHAPRFFVGLGNAALLRGQGIAQVTELDWWQSAALNSDIRVHGVPAQHFSGRGLFDVDATLWLGYVIEGPAGPAFFAGDTGFGPHFAAIRARFGPVRLAILPIGAFEPRWFMEVVHEDPSQAVLAQQVLGAHTALAMHFGTFALADDAQDEPIRALHAALAGVSPPGPFWTLRPGEGRVVPEAPAH